MSFSAKNPGCPGETDVRQFFESVSRGLHQAAQPLTVLQGMLEHALLDIHTAEEYRAILLRLMSEAYRLTTRFNDLRELSQEAESSLRTGTELDFSPNQKFDSECAILVGTEHKHV